MTLAEALTSPLITGLDVWLLPVAALALAYYFRVIPTIEIRRSK